MSHCSTPWFTHNCNTAHLDYTILLLATFKLVSGRSTCRTTKLRLILENLSVFKKADRLKKRALSFWLRTGWSQRVAHLADDIPVGETDDHPVLGCVVLVLILNDQALTSKVVSLSLWMEQTHQSLKFLLKITKTLSGRWLKPDGSPLLLLNLTWYLLK